MFRLCSAALCQQLVDPLHHCKRVGHIKHVCLATRPSTVRIEINCAALVYEAPTDDVRFFAMAAGRQTLGMTRCRTGLADLIQMRHKAEHGLLFAALIDQRFAAAERSLGRVQEIPISAIRPHGRGFFHRIASSSSRRQRRKADSHRAEWSALRSWERECLSLWSASLQQEE